MEEGGSNWRTGFHMQTDKFLNDVRTILRPEIIIILSQMMIGSLLNLLVRTEEENGTG